jgi:hypothetical protein
LNSSDACASMTYSSYLSHLYFIDVCVCVTYVGQPSYLISSDAFARLTTSSRSSHVHAPRSELKRISWSGRFLVKRFEHMYAYQMHVGKCTFDTQKVLYPLKVQGLLYVPPDLAFRNATFCPSEKAFISVTWPQKK